MSWTSVFIVGILKCVNIFGTSVLVWRVPDHCIEQPDLTQKNGDQQGGAGGVGGGRQEEGDPGGDCEHGGGQVVHPHVLRVQVRQCHFQSNHGKPGSVALKHVANLICVVALEVFNSHLQCIQRYSGIQSFSKIFRYSKIFKGTQIFKGIQVLNSVFN